MSAGKGSREVNGSLMSWEESISCYTDHCGRLTFIYPIICTFISECLFHDWEKLLLIIYRICYFPPNMVSRIIMMRNFDCESKHIAFWFRACAWNHSVFAISYDLAWRNFLFPFGYPGASCISVFTAQKCSGLFLFFSPPYGAPATPEPTWWEF